MPDLKIDKRALLLLFLLFAGCSVISTTQKHRVYVKALKQYEKEEYANAVQLFDSVIELDYELGVAYAFRGYSHYKLGQYDSALRDLKTARKLGNYSADVLEFIGEIYYYSEEYDSSEIYYLLAAGNDQDDDTTFYYLANIYMKKGSLNDAASFIDVAIKLDPGNPDYYYTKALILEDNNKSNEALDNIDTALSIKKGYVYLLLKGIILNSLERYDESLIQTSEALELDSLHSPLYATRAMSYVGLNKIDSACKFANYALKLDSTQRRAKMIKKHICK